MSLAIALALMTQAAQSAPAKRTPTPKASPTPTLSPYQSTAENFLICMQHLVESAEILRTPPPDFAVSFAGSCKTEETSFRTEATKVAILQGRTPDAAIKEVDANITRSRRAFVDAQAAYIAPDKAPQPQPSPTPAAKKKRTPKKTS